MTTTGPCAGFGSGTSHPRSSVPLVLVRIAYNFVRKLTWQAEGAEGRFVCFPVPRLEEKAMPVHTSGAARRSNGSLFALILAVLALAGCGGGSSSSFKPVEVLYSAGGTNSTGIQFQIFPVNPTTGALGPPAIQSNIDLGVMAIIPSGRFYYAAEDNGILGYSIGPAGTLTPLAGSPFPADFRNPLAVTVDPTSKFLYAAGGKRQHIRHGGI